MDLVTFWLRLEELIPVKVLPKTMGSWFFLFFLPWFSFSFLFFCRIFYWICVGRARVELILNLVPCCLLAIVLQSLFDCLWSEFFSTSSQGWVSHEIPFEVSALHIFNGVILAAKKWRSQNWTGDIFVCAWSISVSYGSFILYVRKMFRKINISYPLIFIRVRVRE